jgi:hypothetical protein
MPDSSRGRWQGRLRALPVRQQLDRYGIGRDAYYDTPGEALEAFRAAKEATGDLAEAKPDQILERSRL